MLLTIKQIAHLIDYTDCGTIKLLNKINMPIKKTGIRYYLDTRINHPFAQSIHLQRHRQHMQILYSITELREYFNSLWKTNLDYKTIRQLLVENDVKSYGARKKFVFLYDLLQFGQQIRQQLGKSHTK